MEINEKNVYELVKSIVAEMQSEPKSDGLVPVGISNRHIHLSKEDVATLFGEGYALTPIKDLSQPGQLSCKEQLTIIGPSMRAIEGVRVLGPERKASQVEISLTDAYQLRLRPPVRESGNLKGSAPVTIIGPKGVVTLNEGCIIANRHIHMSPSEASAFGLKDFDRVTVEVVDATRPARWYGVQVRVHQDFRLEMHVDTDDANSVGMNAKSAKVRIVGKE